MIINKKKDGSKYARSSLERKFERLWKSHYPDIDLTVEVSLVTGRRFRWDYVHFETKTAIEICGGTFMKQGGHSSSTGIRKDYEKNNLAIAFAGYKTFFLGTSQVNLKNVQLIGDYVTQLVQGQE